MAIDSAEKRRSAAGVPFLPLGPGVTPNASKDAEWRQQVAWSYSGISAGAPLFFAEAAPAVYARVKATPTVYARVNNGAVSVSGRVGATPIINTES